MFIVYFRRGYKIEINVLKLKCRFCKGLFIEVYSMPYWIRLACTCIFNCSPKFIMFSWFVLYSLSCLLFLYFAGHFVRFLNVLVVALFLLIMGYCLFYLCWSCVLDFVLVFEVVLLFFSSAFCRFLDGDFSLLLMLKALRCSIVVGLFASELLLLVSFFSNWCYFSYVLKCQGREDFLAFLLFHLLVESQAEW